MIVLGVIKCWENRQVLEVIKPLKIKSFILTHKSALMNVLAGRQKMTAAGRSLSDAVTACANAIDTAVFRCNVAHVM